MAHSHQMYLVPLNQDLKEDTSLPKVPLSRGPNSIGRNTVSVSDKRLSRNHLTLTASPDGSATVLVEGSNPIVVNSRGQRRKLYHQQEGTIANNDIIELIPGHHVFKYATLSGERNVNSPSFNVETDVGVVAAEPSRKRPRQSVQVELKNSPVREVSLVAGSSQNTLAKGDACVEAIRHFRVPDYKMPSTFRLLGVQGLPQWANTSSVSIGDVMQGDIIVAILSNYMVDLDWLLPACPSLAKVPHVLILHGEGDGTVEHMKRKKPANWILHKPPLPISYGTHHSKAMFLVYPKGIRVVVHTANLIHVDWNNKSQGLWMQDFPWKDESNSTKGCVFENDLIDYLSALKWPAFTANVPSLGSVSITPSFFRKFDYSSATVRLIASVPGYHTGPNLKRWGHMKLRSVLQDCTFDKEFLKSPLVYQFSSLGSLDEKWMTELASSMSSGVTEDKTPLGLGEPLIVWPSVEDVRCSLEGYAAGSCIPSPQKNVERAFLNKYWARWKASHTGRCRAMPHIKTFTRYNGQKLAWFLLTSANLSKAAWGALQKNNSQLTIRSYELGVLFLPSSIKMLACGFSCTENVVYPDMKNKNEAVEKSDLQRTTLVTLAFQGSKNEEKSREVITLPVPYELPPQPYSANDVPWSWDRRYNKKDVYGQTWPRV